MDFLTTATPNKNMIYFLQSWNYNYEHNNSWYYSSMVQFIHQVSIIDLKRQLNQNTLPVTEIRNYNYIYKTTGTHKNTYVYIKLKKSDPKI